MFLMPGARARGLPPEVAGMRRSMIAYTPTVTSFSGAFTTVSANGRFRRFGKYIFFGVEVIITNVGTAGGSIIVTLPAQPAINLDGVPDWVFSGRENAGSGLKCRDQLQAAAE